MLVFSVMSVAILGPKGIEQRAEGIGKESWQLAEGFSRAGLCPRQKLRNRKLSLPLQGIVELRFLAAGC
jgi:hypothetical protein